MSKDTNRSWGGRFSEATDQFVQEFTASVTFDRRLYREDIAGSRAHGRMLADRGIISAEDFAAIDRGLSQIQEEIERGEFTWQLALEDVHMNIEARLTELVGDAGKRLHTGRSRNDQVATDIRLYLRGASEAIEGLLAQLEGHLLDRAEAEADTIMAGLTHLQPAQPITFGHHLLAYREMFKRDRQRFADGRDRLNFCPLGAAALAGTSYPIDRAQTARELGFRGPCANSLDAVSDRDFAIEFTAAASIFLMHCSRLSEELILWNSAPFKFIDLPDRFCTGSSIMPQKKNPDVPELIRGKSGRVYGHLMGLLTLMKSQPLAYNKDNQEDKEPLFDTVDTVRAVLLALNGLVPHLRANRAAMRASAAAGQANATDLADHLVRQGVPFRDSHELVGRAVALAVARNCGLEELPREELQELCDGKLGADLDFLKLANSVASRDHFGGTAPAQVRERIKEARAELAALAPPKEG